MSNKERLEFLYNPKALLEYDNEKYLLGASIPENISKILGEVNEEKEGLALEDEIDDKEILTRLKEDPLLIIKKMEIKHNKALEELQKKKDEFIQIKNKYKRKRSSLSRSPDAYTSRINNRRDHIKDDRRSPNKNNKLFYKQEKLQNMIKYGKMIQNERASKFNKRKIIDTTAQNSSLFYSNSYMKELRDEITEKKHLFKEIKRNAMNL